MGWTSGFYARDDLPRAHWDETEFSFNTLKLEQFGFTIWGCAQSCRQNGRQCRPRQYHNFSTRGMNKNIQLSPISYGTRDMDKNIQLSPISYGTRDMNKNIQFSPISRGSCTDKWATAWQNPVWLESSLSTWRNTGPLTTYWAHSDDPEQTRQMPRLIRVFAGRTCDFVGFVVQRLIISANAWYLSHRRTATAQVSLCIHASLSEPSLYAHSTCILPLISKGPAILSRAALVTGSSVLVTRFLSYFPFLTSENTSNISETLDVYPASSVICKSRVLNNAFQ